MTQMQGESKMSLPKTTAVATNLPIVVSCSLRVLGGTPYQKGIRTTNPSIPIPYASTLEGSMTSDPVGATGTPQSFDVCSEMGSWNATFTGEDAWCTTPMSNGAICGQLPQTEPYQKVMMNRGLPSGDGRHSRGPQAPIPDRAGSS